MGAKPDSLNKTPVEFFLPEENRKELFQSRIRELLQKLFPQLVFDTMVNRKTCNAKRPDSKLLLDRDEFLYFFQSESEINFKAVYVKF